VGGFEFSQEEKEIDTWDLGMVYLGEIVSELVGELVSALVRGRYDDIFCRAEAEY